jgi:hypothetical protein
MPDFKIRSTSGWVSPVNITTKGASAWSQVNTISVKSGSTWSVVWSPPPAAPVLTVSNTNAYTNAATWTEPSSILPITSYTLQRSEDNATWTTIYTGLTRSFSDTGLTQTTTYYYRVSASNVYLSGPYSTTVSRATRTATFKRSTFNSSGTFNKPIGVTSVQVLAIQGGSSTPPALRSYFTQTEDDGAGPYTVYYVNLYPSSGGGSGGFAVNTGITTPISALSYSVAVGAGGTNSGSLGADLGGASSFNASSLNSTVSVIADQSSGRGGGGSTEGFNESNNGPSFFYSADVTGTGGPGAFNSSDGGTSGGSATWFGATFNTFIENLAGMGGGGGGLGGAANGTSGGPGRYFQEYGSLTGTGTSVIYGAGASGGYVSENGGPLAGAAAPANTGSAGGAGNSGASGVVFIGWFD